jgi:eukaryotic-like serine/threonine-protein kinase
VRDRADAGGAPMLDKILDERVVEVRVAVSNGRERRGAGFVVSPGRILTALHVLLGDNRLSELRVPTVPTEIRVRSLGDLLDHIGDVRDIDPDAAARKYDTRTHGDHRWAEATMIWPDVGARFPRFEFAVLEVANTRNLRVLRDSPSLLVTEASDGESCRAVGFPSWSSQDLKDGSTIVDPSVVHATIKRGGSIFRSTTEIHIESGAPETREEWSGLSGAALTSKVSKALVGIVSLARNAKGNDVLAATLLSDVAADDAFDGFWRAGGLSKPRRALNFLHLPFSPPSESGDRELKRLLEAVRRAWIDGVLFETLDGQQPLPINVIMNRAGVELPWREASRADFFSDLSIESSDPIECFEAAGRFMLVLGPAGSGKTNCLLRIAAHLCDRCLRGGIENEPVPVVFPLASWTPRYRDVGRWLSLELQRRYKVPKHLCDRWVAGRSVLPLFDGLDEVPAGIRAECIVALNEFVEAASPPGAVVCTRSHEYQEASRLLRLHAALSVYPLKADVVESHVRATGLHRLEEQIRLFPVLGELASTPLMLRVLTRTYGRGRTLIVETPATLANLRAATWQLYVAAMMDWGRDRQPGNFGANGLAWIQSMARVMLRNNLIVFHVERMQASALSANSLVMLYAVSSRVLTTVIAGLMTGTVAGFGRPLSTTLGFNTSSVPAGDLLSKLVGDVSKSISVAVITGVVIGITESARLIEQKVHTAVTHRGWMSGTTHPAVLLGLTILPATAVTGLDSVLLLPFWASLLFSIRATGQSFREDIHSGQYLTWSGVRAVRGLGLGAAVGALFLALGWYQNGLSYGAIYATAATTLGAMWAGLSVRAATVSELRSVGPVLWMRNALLAAALFGGASAGVFATTGLIVAYVFQIGAQDAWVWLGVGATKGGIVAVVAFFIYGGVDLVQHWQLRALLSISRTLPLRLNPMLTWAVDINFLTRVGGGYMFVHRDLQQYFGTSESANASHAVSVAVGKRNGHAQTGLAVSTKPYDPVPPA